MPLKPNVLTALRGIVGEQNVLTQPEDVIPYGFDGTAADEVGLPARDFRKFALHPDMIQKTPCRIGCEGDQQVEIAIRPEISAKPGAEQF